MHADITFTLDAYDVAVDMVYPPDSVHYDGILVSGARTCPSTQCIISLIPVHRRVRLRRPRVDQQAGRIPPAYYRRKTVLEIIR